MTHRNVEALLGRLATDPLMRRRFVEDRGRVLGEFTEQGFELTPVELDALAATDADAIQSFAATLDPRIRRAVIGSGPPMNRSIGGTEPHTTTASSDLQELVMRYDPFARGTHPVGVRTLELSHTSLSAHPVPMELWYPATEAIRGKDLDEATCDRYQAVPSLPVMTQQAVRDASAAAGVFPLFMYFHGGYGQRRESSRICTHLASHGYIVASANFPGDNMSDLIPVEGQTATVATTPIDESARRRPEQASRFIDLILQMKLPSGARLDPDRIGAGGISMGGFTALALNSVDGRLGAVFPVCPMFGERSLSPQVRRLQHLLRVDNWKRQVPTLLLTGELDPLVNVEDIRSLYTSISSPKRLVVLRKAGHMHFADNAEAGHEWYRTGYLSGSFPDPEIDGIALGTAMRPFSELCTEANATDTARGLCLAHMDAHLKQDRHARAFLEGDLEGTFAARGIGIEVAAAVAARSVTAPAG